MARVQTAPLGIAVPGHGRGPGRGAVGVRRHRHSPGHAAAPVHTFHFHHGVARNMEKERASRVSYQALNAPPDRISGGTTFRHFIRHVLHVPSASAGFRLETPIHPVGEVTLPRSVTLIVMLLVCVWRVLHTNGGNSTGGTGARRRFLSEPAQGLLRYVRRVPRGCPATGRNGGGAPEDPVPANRPSSRPVGIP